MNRESICVNCKLRVGDYCFCGDEPESLTDNPILKCDYFYNDSNSTYYEFIDGYEHCNKLKRIELHKRIKELERQQAEDCEGCMYENKSILAYPCSDCKNNHKNYWRPNNV